MTNPVAVLVAERDTEGRSRKVLHLACPACNVHQVTVEQEPGMSGPVWEWDGNLEAPTVNPSILVSWTYGEERLPRVCHSFLRGGRWQFLADCTHELAGQTADMKPLPDWLVAEARTRNA